MTQHTPGPWATSKGAYGALHVGPAKLDHPGREAAQYAAERGRDLLAQREADAALIAAAPDMLARLNSIIDTIETLGDATGHHLTNAIYDIGRDARAAIAKAKGGAA
jgi:hypothetical protein